MPRGPSSLRLSPALRWVLLWTGSLVAVTVIMTFLAGKVTGVEFSPTHFQIRSFSFYEIPLFGLQVTPIERSTRPASVTNYLISQNALQIPPGPPAKWHLVQIQRGFQAPALADAEILTSRLELEGYGDMYWDRWSREHRATAALFWPIVQRLAERELYLILPELFQLAERETEPAVFQQEIDRVLPLAYQQLAEDLFEANQPELARAVLADALRDYPQNSSLQSAAAERADR